MHIEMNSSGWAFYDFLFEKGYNCTQVANEDVKLGKNTRVASIEPPLVGGRVVLIEEGNWVESFIEQCEGFPKAKHDDKVDVLCYMVLKYLLGESSPYLLY